MVPLAFFNGGPVVGCLCADGSYKSNCPALRGPAARTAKESCCCKVACCAKPEADETNSSCCQTTAVRPADSGVSRPDDGFRYFVKQNCCRVVVQAGVLPPLLDAQRDVGGHQVPALGEGTLESTDLLSGTQIGSYVDDDTGQPACDLVIRLRRLVI